MRGGCRLSVVSCRTGGWQIVPASGEQQGPSIRLKPSVGMTIGCRLWSDAEGWRGARKPNLSGVQFSSVRRGEITMKRIIPVAVLIVGLAIVGLGRVAFLDESPRWK